MENRGEKKTFFYCIRREGAPRTPLGEIPVDHLVELPMEMNPNEDYLPGDSPSEVSGSDSENDPSFSPSTSSDSSSVESDEEVESDFLVDEDEVAPECEEEDAVNEHSTPVDADAPSAAQEQTSEEQNDGGSDGEEVEEEDDDSVDEPREEETRVVSRKRRSRDDDVDEFEGNAKRRR